MAKTKILTDAGLATLVSEIKTQLDGKAASNHTHKYAGSSSAGGAATSANKVNSSLTVQLNGGTTEGTNKFTFNGSAAKGINITASSIGAAASSHNHDDKYYTETEIDSKISTLNTAINGKANSSHTHSISNITNLQSALDGKSGILVVNINGGESGYYASKTFSEIATALSQNNMVYCDFNYMGLPILSPIIMLSLDMGMAVFYVSFGDIGLSIVITSDNEVTVEEFNYPSLDQLNEGLSTKVPTSRTVNGKALSSNITLSASDVGAYAKSEVDTKLSGKANSSHGNHVPATETANNAKFLRNDNTWQTVTPANIGASATGHKHAATDITSGTLSSDRLPTVPVAKGGTGSTTAAGALTNLGLTATAAELNYCDGVTSNIQTQLNGKVPTSRTVNGKALSGNITLSASDVGAAASGHIHNTLYHAGTSTAVMTVFNGSDDATKMYVVPPESNADKIYLGASNRPWKGIYADEVLVGGKSVSTSGHKHNELYQDAATSVILSDGVLAPFKNNSVSLGTANQRYSDIYSHYGYFKRDLHVTGECSFGATVSGQKFVANNGLYTYASDGETINTLIFLSSNNHINVGSETGTTAHTGNVYINSSAGNVALYTPAGYVIWDKTTSSTDGYTGIFRTSTDNKALLGSSSYRWKKISAGTSTIATSDEREKSDITSIADYPVTFSRNGSGNIFEQLFDKLNPTTYYFNDDEKPELHIGFIAQDIVRAAEELGMSEDDLAFIDHGFWTDEETGEERDRYGLAYEEFIALNTYVIQKQKEKINTLEERISKLEESINIK